MPANISPLDDRFISIKAAAAEIARTRKNVSEEAVMDLLKHAIFVGELEPPRDRPDRTPDEELLQLKIEAPRRDCYINGLPLDAGPEEYFGVGAFTIAEILDERDALPGPREKWVEFTQRPRAWSAVERTLVTLAYIPITAYPPTAKDILGGVLAPKKRLRDWMVGKGIEPPDSLKPARRDEDDWEATRRADSNGADSAARSEFESADDDEDPFGSEAGRGRPRKRSWSRVVALVRQLHSASPQLKFSTLAQDARKAALKEFDEMDVPSAKTIERHMKSIIGPEA